MKRPTINDYPQTDSRTYYSLDGTVNWKKYAKALEEYADSLSPVAESLTGEPMTPQDAPQVAPQEKPMTAEGWFDNNFDCYGDSEFEVVPAMTKEVFLQYASLKPTVAEREVGEE